MMFGLSGLVKSASISATFAACANFLLRARPGRRYGRFGREWRRRASGRQSYRAAIDGNLAGDDEGAFVVAVLDDFEEIAGLIGRQGFRPQSSRMSSLTRAIERRSLPYRASPWAIARSAKSRGMRV